MLAVREDRGPRRPDDHGEEQHHQDQVHLEGMRELKTLLMKIIEVKEYFVVISSLNRGPDEIM